MKNIDVSKNLNIGISKININARITVPDHIGMDHINSAFDEAEQLAMQLYCEGENIYNISDSPSETLLDYICDHNSWMYSICS